MSRLFRLLSLVFCLLSAVCSLQSSALDYQISWLWHSNQTAAAVQEQSPWLQLSPERVDIEISYNAGTAWTRLASGIPSAYGTNTYAISLPDSPAWASTAAVVRVQTRQSYAQPRTIATAAINIAGIHLVNPPASVTNGVSVQLRWTAAGAGPLIQLGYQAVGADLWEPLAVLGNMDSTRAATTNAATWYVDGLPAGPSRIVLQSMSDTNISRIASIEVAP